ncbi:unnamed protein product, partial [Allacma fusca]
TSIPTPPIFSECPNTHSTIRITKYSVGHLEDGHYGLRTLDGGLSNNGSGGVEQRRRGAVECEVGPGGVDVGQGAAIIATDVVGDFDGEEIDKILK